MSDSTSNLTEAEKEWLQHKTNEIVFASVMATARGKRFAPMCEEIARMKALRILEKLRAKKRSRAASRLLASS